MRFKAVCMIFTLHAGMLVAFPYFACAQEKPYTVTLTGPLGLNTMPSARVDKTGTIRAGISTLDPYAHGYVGFQLAEPLYINVRQTAKTSNINEDPDRLYPGVDIKLRLLEENRARPEVAIGLQSIVGHKRMAGEYIAASKRYKNFDFTAGLGWGRYGTARHFNNPLKGLVSHFGKDRMLDGEMPNEPTNWFTGDSIGFFGGIEYFTPIKDLSIKFDYGADRYTAEKAAFNYDAPAPWSLGLDYQPVPWASIGIAAQGTDKIMARLSLQGLLSDWKDSHKPDSDLQPMRAFRTGIAAPGGMEMAGAREGIFLQNTGADIYSANTMLVLDPHVPAPYQLGRAAVFMSNHGGPAVEEFTITPTNMGLQGPSITLNRRDFEQAITHRSGSPEEIWRGVQFDTEDKKLFARHNRFVENAGSLGDICVVLDNQFSLSEEDSGTLYRSSLIGKARAPRFMGIIDGGFGLRLNIKDNLHNIRDLRPLAPLPVRSDVDQFADTRLALEESWVAYTHSFKPDLHMALTAGYLEEMYAGVGGEILYRPFQSRFAIGAESWLALKRDPYSALNLNLNGDHLLTGHVNAYYDMPEYDVTLKARAGRYLAEDVGGTIGLEKTFRNGAKLEGFITMTNYADFDLFGGTTHAYHGVRLSLPLGGYKHMPQNASVRMKAEPFGRDIGQALENPLPLYEATRQFSYSHLAEHWNRVLPPDTPIKRPMFGPKTFTDSMGPHKKIAAR
jgi:hypothetical protein